MSIKGFKRYDDQGNLVGVEKYDYNSLDNIPKNLAKSEELEQVQQDMTEYMNGDVLVPDYWVSELEAKAYEIQIAMENAGRNKSAFLWYTDAHRPNSSKMSPVLLLYLCRNTSMNKVNFGGDIIGDPIPHTHENIEYVYEWRKQIAGLLNHHSVYGNHDVNHRTTDVSKMAYAYMLAPEESSDMVVSEVDSCYYIDNPSEKTRYIYLSYLTNNPTEMVAQAQFIADTLKSVPYGWHIIVLAHRWWQYTSSKTPTVGSVPTYEKDILNVFDTYNARGTRASSNYFPTLDFADAKGKVELCVGGHIHIDYDFLTDGGIPVVITTADTNQERVPDTGVDSGTLKTITESAVFGFIVDYSDSASTKITVVGVGRGTSRVITSDGGITVYNRITNYLNNCTTSNTTVLVEYGTPYSATITAKSGYTLKRVTVTMGDTNIPVENGVINIESVTGDIIITAVASSNTGEEVVNLFSTSADGYMENTRLSTSATSACNGAYTTNYIPCKLNDIVCIEGLDVFKYDSTSDARFHLLDLSKALAVGDCGYLKALQTNSYATYDEAKNIIEVTAGIDGSTLKERGNTAYIRFCGVLMSGYTIDDVVIYIKSGETVGNRIPLSVDTNGLDYIGINGEDGYNVGYRVKSDGSEVVCEGMCMTGYIPYSGQIIRFKNVSLSGSASSYLVRYYDDFTFQTTNSLANLTPDENGIYTIESQNTDGYIRLVAGSINESSVLTLNEEIPPNEELDVVNLIPLSTVSGGGSIYGNGKGYVLDKRLNSGGVEKDATGAIATGFIPVTKDTVLHIKNFANGSTDYFANSNNHILLYNSSYTLLTTSQQGLGSQLQNNNIGIQDDIAGVYTVKLSDILDNSSVAFVRFSTVVLNGTELAAGTPATDDDAKKVVAWIEGGTSGGDTGGDSNTEISVNLNRTYVSGTVGGTVGANLDESKAYLNTYYGTKAFSSNSCIVSDVTENSVTVKESGSGGINVAYPIHLPDLATQRKYRITFDYSGTGKCRTYYFFAKSDGTMSSAPGLYTNDTSGASGSADVEIDALNVLGEEINGYEWLIILLGSNTGSIKTFENVTITKV